MMYNAFLKNIYQSAVVETTSMNNTIPTHVFIIVIDVIRWYSRADILHKKYTK